MPAFIALFLCLSAILSAAGMRTGTYRGRVVTFEDVDGVAVYQGDIILGNTANIELPPGSDIASAKIRATSVVSASRLWPGGKIPYTIDSGLSASLQSRIAAAIDHWNTKTSISLAPRAAESNYVRFTSSTSTIACSSSVGMVGGPQLIRLPDGCGLGPIIHEIGHAVGLWHEQERADRNQFITVLYENIDKQSASNYDQVFSSGQDYGHYDFNSIMHYGAFDFSKDGILPAMETVPPGIPLGQRLGLSAQDIDTVQRIYGYPPSQVTVATTPGGLQLLIDGQLVNDRTSFTWAPGSVHTIRAPFQGDDTTRYYFASWSDAGAETHNITVSADTTVYTANFARQYKITSQALPAAGGGITLSPAPADGFYNDRSNIQIAATPAAGFKFQQWSVTPSPSLNPKFHTVRGAAVISALFSTGVVNTITSDPVGRPVIVDGATVSTPYSVAWAPGSQHTLDIDPTQPNFVHYSFAGWTDGGARKRTVQAASAAQTFTAKFTPQFPLTLNFTTRDGNVAANPSSPDGFYDAGATVQLTATPAGQLQFATWSGDLGGRANPATITMDDQKLINAYFVSRLPDIYPVGGATGVIDSVSPGQILVIYGANLGPPTLEKLQVSGGKVTTSLAGTQVLFDGIPGPVIYTSANQVSAVVPYAVAGHSSTNIQVSYNGRTTAPGSLPVAGSRPGLFTLDSSGQNGAAALNQNGSVNGPSNPAHRGEIVVLYATGEGQTNPAGVDGQVANSVYPKPVLPVAVRIGGLPAAVHYAGAAPGFVSGVMQINAQVPDGIRTGPGVPVQIVVGPNTSPSGVTLAIE